MTGLSQVQYFDPYRVRYADRPTAAIVAGTTALFTVSGRVELVDIYGTITEGVEAIPCTIKLRCPASAGYDITAALDINAFPTAQRFWCQGNPGNALRYIGGGETPVRRADYGTPTIEGDLQLVASASPATGKIRWEVLWRALRPGSTLVAA